MPAANNAQACVGCLLDLHRLGRRVPYTIPLDAWKDAADFGIDIQQSLGPNGTSWRHAGLDEPEVFMLLDDQMLACGRRRGPQRPVRVPGMAGGRTRAPGTGLNAGGFVSTSNCVGLLMVVPGQTVQSVTGGFECPALTLDGGMPEPPDLASEP